MVGKRLTLKGFYGLWGAAAAANSRRTADLPYLHWPLSKSSTLRAKLPALEIDHRAHVAKSPKRSVTSAPISGKLALSLRMFAAKLCGARAQRAFWSPRGATERGGHIEARLPRAAVPYVMSSD
jgi:hypothetical protein